MNFPFLRGALVILACLCSLPSLCDPKVSEEMEFYLTDIQVDDYKLAEGVSTYKTGKSSYIHLQSFLEAVEFPIIQERGIWSGWYLSENRQFELNLSEGAVYRSLHEPVSLPDQAWLETDEGLFVSIDALEEWFDLDLDFDPRTQILAVQSSDPLPFQQRIDRLARGRRYQDPADQRLIPDVFVEDRYRLLTPPQVDLSTSHRIQETDGNRVDTTSVLLLSSFDLLKHAVVYSGSLNFSDISGTTDSQRLTLERRAATRDSTLQLGINRYTLGDVFPTQSNLVATGGSGLGFTIQRAREQASTSLDQVTITGDAPAGWLVELYRNGVLIEFGQVDSDGRYVFPDQETVQGHNLFVVKLFGPQGQIREEQHSIWGGGLELAQGDYNYSISHVDFSERLLEGESDGADALPSNRTTDMRFSYALTDWLQLGGGYSEANVRERNTLGAFDNTQYYSLLGRISGTAGILLAEYANQRDGGTAWTLRYLGKILGQNLSLAHESLNNFESPHTIQGVELDSSTKLSLIGNLNLLNIDHYTLRLTHDNRPSDISNTRLFNRLSTSWKQMTFSNDLEYNRITDVDDSYRGNFRIAGRYHNYNFSSQINYDPEESSPVNQVSAALRWYIHKDLFNNTNIIKNLEDDRLLRINNVLSWRFHDVDLSFTVDGGSDDFWAVGIGVNVHFGYDYQHRDFYTSKRNITQTGRAGIRFFIDENNNGTIEPEEPLVPEVIYKNKLTSDPNTRVVSMRNIPAYSAYVINTKDFLFDDPFLTPRFKRYEIYIHPGSHIHVDIPVQQTGDIEGHIYRRLDNSLIGLSGFKVELLDIAGEVKAGTNSEFDGYFSFTEMLVGEYQIRVQLKDQQGWHYSDKFTLDREQGYVTVNQILAEPQTEGRTYK
jgi:hypothetical protein